VDGHLLLCRTYFLVHALQVYYQYGSFSIGTKATSCGKVLRMSVDRVGECGSVMCKFKLACVKPLDFDCRRLDIDKAAQITHAKSKGINLLGRTRPHTWSLGASDFITDMEL